MVYSVLVSPSGIFSVYLFFSLALNVLHMGHRPTQTSRGISTGQILPSAVCCCQMGLTLHSANTAWPSFAPYADRSAAAMPGLQLGERLKPGNPTRKQSYASTTSHSWEPSLIPESQNHTEDPPLCCSCRNEHAGRLHTQLLHHGFLKIHSAEKETET